MINRNEMCFLKYFTKRSHVPGQKIDTVYYRASRRGGLIS